MKNSEQELTELKKQLTEIEIATGIKLNKWTPSQKIIDRLKVAESLDTIGRNLKTLTYDSNNIVKDAENIVKDAQKYRLLLLQ